MLNPGALNLCNFSITDNTPALGSLADVVESLEGMVALAVSLMFQYTSGGGADLVKAYVQTSLDQGSTWVDIACVTFGTASKTVVLNFSALTPKISQVTPTDGALADNTAIDGVLGDRVRVKLKTTGAAYGANTLLVGRAIAR